MSPPQCDGPPSDDGTTSRARESSGPVPTLAHSDSGAAFLDAPGVDADDLFAIVRRALAAMACDAILTVFTNQPGMSAAAAEWCAAHRVELVAVITHDTGGETLAFRRAGIV